MPQTFTQSDYFWNQPRTKTTRKNVLAVQGMSAPQEAKIYTPTLQQKTARLGSKLAEKIVPKKTAQRFGRDLGEAVNWLTPAGNVMDAQQFGRDAQGAAGRGDILGAVGNGAGLAMAALPIPGALRKPLVKGTEKALKSGIRAFHGSPHDFDRFDMSKLGTGEGAQAYGHGLYFAENEGVAKEYRDALSKGAYSLGDGAALRGDDLVNSLKSAGVSDEVSEIARWYTNRHFPVEEYIKDIKLNFPDDYKKVSSRLGGVGKGKMYEVNINASPDEFLDWDAPIYEQNPFVAERLQGLGIDTAPKAQWTVKETPSGHTVYNVWGERHGTFKDRAKAESLAASRTRDHNTGGVNQAYLSLGGNNIYSGLDKGDASNKLHAAGISGIKYKDAGSRAAGEGTSNYVVFNDSIIDILRKYGLAGAAVTGTGAAALQSEPAQAQY